MRLNTHTFPEFADDFFGEGRRIWKTDLGSGASPPPFDPKKLSERKKLRETPEEIRKREKYAEALEEHALPVLRVAAAGHPRFTELLADPATRRMILGLVRIVPNADGSIPENPRLIFVRPSEEEAYADRWSTELQEAEKLIERAQSKVSREYESYEGSFDSARQINEELRSELSEDMIRRRYGLDAPALDPFEAGIGEKGTLITHNKVEQLVTLPQALGKALQDFERETYAVQELLAARREAVSSTRKKLGALSAVDRKEKEKYINTSVQAFIPQQQRKLEKIQKDFISERILPLIQAIVPEDGSLREQQAYKAIESRAKELLEKEVNASAMRKIHEYALHILMRHTGEVAIPEERWMDFEERLKQEFSARSVANISVTDIENGIKKSKLLSDTPDAESIISIYSLYLNSLPSKFTLGKDNIRNFVEGLRVHFDAFRRGPTDIIERRRQAESLYRAMRKKQREYTRSKFGEESESYMLRLAGSDHIVARATRWDYRVDARRIVLGVALLTDNASLMKNIESETGKRVAEWFTPDNIHLQRTKNFIEDFQGSPLENSGVQNMAAKLLLEGRHAITSTDVVSALEDSKELLECQEVMLFFYGFDINENREDLRINDPSLSDTERIEQERERLIQVLRGRSITRKAAGTLYSLWDKDVVKRWVKDNGGENAAGPDAFRRVFASERLLDDRARCVSAILPPEVLVGLLTEEHVREGRLTKTAEALAELLVDEEDGKSILNTDGLIAAIRFLLQKDVNTESLLAECSKDGAMNNLKPDDPQSYEQHEVHDIDKFKSNLIEYLSHNPINASHLQVFYKHPDFDQLRRNHVDTMQIENRYGLLEEVAKRTVDRITARESTVIPRDVLEKLADVEAMRKGGTIDPMTIIRLVEQKEGSNITVNIPLLLSIIRYLTGQGIDTDQLYSQLGSVLELEEYISDARWGEFETALKDEGNAILAAVPAGGSPPSPLLDVDKICEIAADKIGAVAPAQRMRIEDFFGNNPGMIPANWGAIGPMYNALKPYYESFGLDPSRELKVEYRADKGTFDLSEAIKTIATTVPPEVRADLQQVQMWHNERLPFMDKVGTGVMEMFEDWWDEAVPYYTSLPSTLGATDPELRQIREDLVDVHRYIESLRELEDATNRLELRTDWEMDRIAKNGAYASTQKFDKNVDPTQNRLDRNKQGIKLREKVLHLDQVIGLLPNEDGTPQGEGVHGLPPEQRAAIFERQALAGKKDPETGELLTEEQIQEEIDEYLSVIEDYKIHETQDYAQRIRLRHHLQVNKEAFNELKEKHLYTTPIRMQWIEVRTNGTEEQRQELYNALDYVLDDALQKKTNDPISPGASAAFIDAFMSGSDYVDPNDPALTLTAEEVDALMGEIHANLEAQDELFTASFEQNLSGDTVQKWTDHVNALIGKIGENYRGENGFGWFLGTGLLSFYAFKEVKKMWGSNSKISKGIVAALAAVAADYYILEPTYGESMFTKLSMYFRNPEDRKTIREHYRSKAEENTEYQYITRREWNEAMLQMQGMPIDRLVQWYEDAKNNSLDIEGEEPDYMFDPPSEIRASKIAGSRSALPKGMNARKYGYKVAFDVMEALFLQIANRHGSTDVDHGVNKIISRWIDRTDPETAAAVDALDRPPTLLHVLGYEIPSPQMLEANPSLAEAIGNMLGVTAEEVINYAKWGGTNLWELTKHGYDVTAQELPYLGERALETSRDVGEWLRQSGMRLTQVTIDSFEALWYNLKDGVNFVVRKTFGDKEKGEEGLLQFSIKKGAIITTDFIRGARRFHSWLLSEPALHDTARQWERGILEAIGLSEQELNEKQANRQIVREFKALESLLSGGDYPMRDQLNPNSISSFITQRRSEKIIITVDELQPDGSIVKRAVKSHEVRRYLENASDKVAHSIFGDPSVPMPPHYCKTLKPSQQRYVLEVLHAQILGSITTCPEIGTSETTYVADLHTALAEERVAKDTKDLAWDDLFKVKQNFSKFLEEEYNPAWKVRDYTPLIRKQKTEVNATKRKIDGYAREIAARWAEIGALPNGWRKNWLTDRNKADDERMKEQQQKLTEQEGKLAQYEDYHLVKDYLAETASGPLPSLKDFYKTAFAKRKGAAWDELDDYIMRRDGIVKATADVNDMWNRRVRALGSIFEKIDAYEDNKSYQGQLAAQEPAYENLKAEYNQKRQVRIQIDKKGALPVRIDFKVLLNSIDHELLTGDAADRRAQILEQSYDENRKFLGVPLNWLMGSAEYVTFQKSVEQWVDRRIKYDDLYETFEEAGQNPEAVTAYRKYLRQVVLNEVGLRLIMASPDGGEGEKDHILHLALHEARRLDQYLVERERLVTFEKYLELHESLPDKYK